MSWNDYELQINCAALLENLLYWVKGQIGIPAREGSWVIYLGGWPKINVQVSRTSQRTLFDKDSPRVLSGRGYPGSSEQKINLHVSIKRPASQSLCLNSVNSWNILISLMSRFGDCQWTLTRDYCWSGALARSDHGRSLIIKDRTLPDTWGDWEEAPDNIVWENRDLWPLSPSSGDNLKSPGW